MRKVVGADKGTAAGRSHKRPETVYLETIVSMVREPFLVLDGNLRIQSANSSFYNCFHLSQEETSNQQLYELNNGQWNIPALRALLEKHLPENNSIEGFEIEHDFPGIGRKTLRLNVSRPDDLILLVFEEIDGHAGITEQNNVYTLQARLAAIVESSDDAIVSKDLQGVVQSWNQGAARIFGYCAEEMIGQPITRIIPHYLLDEEAHILEKLCRGERIDHYETERITKDGRIINISLTVSPIRDASGRIVGASKVARDITQQKQAEKALVEADRRKTEFLAMLAHELRNPLDAIHNAVQLLHVTSGEDQQSRGRAIIERQTGKLTRLISALLDVSRITQGKIQLRKQPVEASTVIAAAVETVQPLMTGRRHELRVSYTEEPLWLTADPARLEQILVNLLTNAGKYTEPGGCITVTARRDAATVIIKVRDNGIGMSPGTLSQAFELFSQNAPTLDRSDGGLGIGLTLVKRLTEMHGGSIEASSEGPGRGSEFTLRLPLDETAKEAPNLTVATTAATFGPSRRVLIVDDNRDSAEVLSQLLTITGHQVQTVYDGTTALQSAGAFQPDVILLDIGLPGMDGYEVAKRLRQQPEFGQTLLVAVSGYCQEQDRRRSREAGFDHHLAKPIDHETLAALLTEKL